MDLLVSSALLSEGVGVHARSAAWEAWKQKFTSYVGGDYTML